MADKKKPGDINVTMGDGNTVGNIGHVFQNVAHIESGEVEAETLPNGTESVVFRLRIPTPVARAIFQFRGTSLLDFGLRQAPRPGATVLLSVLHNTETRRFRSTAGDEVGQLTTGPLHGSYEAYAIKESPEHDLALSHKIID